MKLTAAGSATMPPFLAGGGEMGALMRAHNWRCTPLGATDTWPQPLRTAVRLLLNTGHPMYIWWGPQLLCFYNDAYRLSIGPERHPSSLGRPAREVWSEIWPIIGPQIEQVMTGRGATWHENQLIPIFRHGKMEDVYWTYSYGPIDDESAQPYGVGGVLVVCTETTQQVLSERRMRTAEARWRELFDQAPSFMCVLQGPEHRFEYANPRYLDMVGRSDIIGKAVLQALPEIEQQGFIRLPDDVFTTGETYKASAAPVKLMATGAGGALELRYLDFVYQPIRDPSGAVTGIFVEGSDVTERVLASAALADSEARFRTLAENMPTLCWIADETGSILWYNNPWYRYTGTTEQEMRGWGWQTVHDPAVLPTVLGRWRASLASGEAFEMVFPLRDANGDFHPFLTRVVPLRDTQGRIVRWFGTNTDITQQHAAEAGLREADRRKDEFLAILAHELRNPLAPVRNAARVLRAPNADAKMREWATTVIDRQVQAMASLLDDLLDVSRITRGHLTLNKQRTALASVVDVSLEIAKPLIDARTHTLTISMPSQSIEIDADPLRLSQVLSNLLTNAAKYMDVGGRIELSAMVLGEMLCISVNDQGIGLEPQSLSSIFDMFSQVKGALDRSEGGLGIGLALVKGLVMLHGGRVEVSSKGLGHGSEFRVWLPLPAEQWDLEKTQQQHSSLPATARRILVVDDNKDAALSLGYLLRHSGHTVQFAHDGPQGLQAANDFRPEIAFLDIGLPTLDGYKLAQAIRRETWGRHMVLYALTGWGQEDDKQRAHAAGFNGHLTKPLDPDKIDALIAHQAGQNG